MGSPSRDDGGSLEDIPVWGRSDVFPTKPVDTDYGLIDSKGAEHSACSESELIEKVANLGAGLNLVWTPEKDTLVVPESVPSLYKVLRKRQARFAASDASDGKRMCLVFGIAVVWFAFKEWTTNGESVRALFSSQLTGLAALLLLIFGLLPLYESWKTRRRLMNTEFGDVAREVPEALFDAWLQRCKVPVTYFLIGCLTLVGLAQFYIDRSFAGIEPSILRAGLLKLQALNYPDITDGDAGWRMFTAPLLHGNVLHLIMNAGGILYLGRRAESLARWPHLLIVFVCSAWVGGAASFYWIPDKIAVGSSGGLLGLLGFMLVFEKIHTRLVPRSAQRRLLAGVILMVIMGILGMSFIDNAAHAGGLFTGMIYAGVVFPKSTSFRRPRSIRRDKIVGWGMIILISTFTTWAIYKIIG